MNLRKILIAISQQVKFLFPQLPTATTYRARFLNLMCHLYPYICQNGYFWPPSSFDPKSDPKCDFPGSTPKVWLELAKKNYWRPVAASLLAVKYTVFLKNILRFILQHDLADVSQFWCSRLGLSEISLSLQRKMYSPFVIDNSPQSDLRDKIGWKWI